MNRENVTSKPIGVIRSAHVVACETPIQPVYAKGCKGRVPCRPNGIGHSIVELIGREGNVLLLDSVVMAWADGKFMRREKQNES
jgi:tRNA (Thr-GGU) A37 N-methylase